MFAETTLRGALAVLETLVEQFPRRPDYRLQRAATYRMLGILLSRTQRPEDAGEAFRKARGLLETLVVTAPKAPGSVAAPWDAPGMTWPCSPSRQASSIWPGMSSVEALRIMGRPRAPTSPTASRRGCLLRDYTNLATVHRRLKEPAAAAEAAQQLPRLAPDDPDQYSLAAWNLALCAGAGVAGPNCAEAEREARKQGYAQVRPWNCSGAIERGSQNIDDSNQPTTTSCVGGTISRSFYALEDV